MVVEAVHNGTSFPTKFAAPSRKYAGARVFLPSEVLSSSCQVHDVHLVVSWAQYGWTKYLAYLLGPIGAYVFMPLFGSLTANYRQFTLLWDEVIEASYSSAENTITLVGTPKGQKDTWVFSISCEQMGELEDHLSAHVPIEQL